MPPVQTSYSENIAAGTPGLVVGTDFAANTGINESATAIPFGRAVSQGTTDKEIVLGGALADFLGISVRDPGLKPEDNDEYPQYANVGYMKRGQIWASPAAAVAAGDPVHYDTNTGRFTNTGGIGPIVGARWVLAGAQDGLSIIELR